MKLRIVIPAFNEEENLPMLLKSLDKALTETRDVQPEFVFVDGGSRDGTLAYLRKWIATTRILRRCRTNCTTSQSGKLLI